MRETLLEQFQTSPLSCEELAARRRELFLVCETEQTDLNEL